jgi:Flp pilus assembly protein TadD
VDTGRAGQAELVMQSVIAVDPGSPRAWVNLGDAQLDAGWLMEAGAAYQEAFRLDPGSAPAYNGLGRTLEAMGKPRKAQAAFRKASSVRPDLNPWTLIPVHPDDFGMQDHIRRSRGKRPPPPGGRQR